MKILTRDKVIAKKSEILHAMKSGKIFVYPTDTIYGIGCNALNSKSVLKIHGIKKREAKPFSVIAPSKKWISENCFSSPLVKKWMAKLPGAYTLILKLKNKRAVSENVNYGVESLGIRIPDNWFAEFIKESGVPFVATSVNLTGEKPITKFSDLKSNIKKEIDYFINDGVIDGKPSVLVNLLDGKEEIIAR